MIHQMALPFNSCKILYKLHMKYVFWFSDVYIIWIDTSRIIKLRWYDCFFPFWVWVYWMDINIDIYNMTNALSRQVKIMCIILKVGCQNGSSFHFHLKMKILIYIFFIFGLVTCLNKKCTKDFFYNLRVWRNKFMRISEIRHHVF